MLELGARPAALEERSPRLGLQYSQPALDNVVIDGISTSNVKASYTNVTLGPGNVNFAPSGTGVTVTDSKSGTSTPNPCTNKWVTF